MIPFFRSEKSENMSKNNTNKTKRKLSQASASIGNDSSCGEGVSDTEVAIVLETLFKEAVIEYFEKHPEVINSLVAPLRHDPELAEVIDEMAEEPKIEKKFKFWK